MLRINSKAGIALGILALVVLVSVLLLRDDNAIPTSSTTSLDLSIGVYSTGALFCDWEETLTFSTTANGRIDFPGGATFRGSFKRPDDGGSVLLDMRIIHTESDDLSISGTYEATIPFTLTFLGSAEKEVDYDHRKFLAGSGSLKYRVPLPYTFEKPQR